MKWELRLGIYLVSGAAILYFLDYWFFHDFNYILDNLLLQLAFLPIYILLSSIIIDKLLTRRDKGLQLKKINMISGAFFAEAGVDLLKKLSGLDQNLAEIQERLVLSGDWSKKEFQRAEQAAKLYKGKIICRGSCFEELRSFLDSQKEFFLRLLENPSLLEHESFSELLWSVFHLAEELSHRQDLLCLTENDQEHLLRDVERVYTSLIVEWLKYMQHLQQDYPYLFSLAVRTNPFNPQAKVEIV